MTLMCRDFIGSLADYGPGELDPDTHAHCEAHLLRCADCVGYLRSYEETIRLSKGAFSYPDDTVPTDVLGELVQAILAARPRARRRRSTYLPS